MNLTPQDILTLRNIAIRAVNECYQVLSAAARTAQSERRNQEARGRPGSGRPTATVASSGMAPGHPSAPPGGGVSKAPPVQKLAFTVNEVAAALGISKSTVWKYRSEGRLEFFKLGNRTLIRADALHAFLDRAQCREMSPTHSELAEE